MNNETPDRDKKLDKLHIIQIGKDKMKIQEDNRFFILEPNRYDINSLMMLIDLKKINKIEEMFEKQPDGLGRLEFIRYLKAELPVNESDPFDGFNLIYGLYKLFCEIDLSGDEIMQWSEFTQFMIDRVEGEEDSNDPNDIKGIKEKEMIKYKRYMISPKAKDYNIHKKDIVTAVFYNKIDKLFLSESQSKSIKIYNPRNGKCEINFNIEKYFQQRLLEEKKMKGGVIKKTKFHVENIKSLTFSVLHLCITPMNILSICLSSNKICFFVFTTDLRANCLHELVTTSLQKRVWYLPEHGIWVSSGRKEETDRHYYLYELDVEFERVGPKIECNYNEGHWYRNAFIDHPEGHEDEILDVIEITKPMLILTACMDGKIRLINIHDKEFLAVWNKHEGGVRSLDYNPFIDTNGLIISTGFEYNINLFATDLSLEDSFKGKLEGHSAPVVSCKFLASSYMCVSVDEDAFVKIWDAKQRQCLQSIAADKKNLTITRLLYMPKYNRFIIYGNKMLFFDAKYRESELSKQAKDQSDINYPIQCDFNKYYMRFYIATMKDLRIYNSENGSLIYVFKKFLEQERFDNETKIRCFTFDYRHRLIYLGFSNGTVQQFNSGNGSLIKPINEYEIEKDGMATVKTHHTKDITSMFVFYNKPEAPEADFILVTTGLDSLVNMYNEKDPEYSTKLRTIRGSHKIGEKVNEILCMDFSRKYNQFATGSIDGIVVLWDFELTKMEELCFIQKYKPGNYNAVYMKFLDPYPVLAVAYSDGSLFLWGIKGVFKYQGQCFFRTKNYFRKDTGTYTPVQISSMIFIHRDLPYDLPQSTKYTNDDIIPNDDDLVIDDDLQSNPSYYQENITKDILIIGDEKGWIRYINLEPIFKKYNAVDETVQGITSSFNIMKKEEIYAESNLVHNMLKEKTFIDKFIWLYPNLIFYEDHIHSNIITYLSIIEEPFSLISVSRDQRVKIFNIKNELLGELYTGLNNPYPPMPWNFKIDLEKLKRKEIVEVLEIAKEIEADMSFYVNIQQENQYLPKEEEPIVKEDEKDPIFKTASIVKKRRFKKIEISKGPVRGIENDVYVNESYEGRYINEMKRKIDAMLSSPGPDVGMNEMSRNVIDNVAANKDITELFIPPNQAQVRKVTTSKKLPKLSSSMKLSRDESDERQGLFSEKFIKKAEENVKDTLILPLLNHEFKSNANVKFKQGETEKILSFEYYQNSYKQCCKLKNSSEPLGIVRANYNLMWNFVENYNKRLSPVKKTRKTIEDKSSDR